MKPIQYHEIPDSYARQTMALAEAHYGQSEADEERYHMDTEWAEAEGMTRHDLDQNLHPEDFVSEADFDAATPAEWEGLDAALAWEQHSHTL